MSKILLFLSSTIHDSTETVTDGQVYDTEEDAITALEATREAEKGLAALFGDKELEIRGRLYAGDPTLDDELRFVKEV